MVKRSQRSKIKWRDEREKGNRREDEKKKGKMERKDGMDEKKDKIKLVKTEYKEQKYCF